MAPKILISGLLLFLTLIIYGQHNIVPIPMPCFEINNPSFPNGSTVVDNYGCIEAPGTANSVNVSGNRMVDFISATEVHLKPGFKAQGFSNTGYFHAGLEKSEIPLVIFTPSTNSGSVGIYEKLEVGVRLTSEIYDQIDNFINETANTTWLNPFSESDINVIAEFYYMSNINTENLEHKIYGYYHNEYIRNTIGDVEDWNYERDTTSFRFRVRFAPDKLGYWKCKIKTEVNGFGTLYAKEFMFKCVSSNTHGYMKTGTNKYFFTIDTETYIPIGQNLTWPKCDINNDCGQYGTVFGNNGSGYHFNLNNPATYLYYHDKMEAMKDAGADFFRLVLAPWNLGIEFERIGRYTSTNINKDRMRCAWELDQIIDKAKELDLNLTLNTDLHYSYEVPASYASYDWDWPSEHCGYPDQGNCYQTDLGLQDPLEFFTNGTAQKYYQQKLRYIISRWGYSSQIGIIEFISEINNVGKQYPVELKFDSNGNVIGCGATALEGDDYAPYHNETNYQIAVDNWHEIMSNYIKNTLGHRQHLLSTSYTGDDRQNDYSYYLPNIDIANYNFYPINPTRYNDVSSYGPDGKIQEIHNLVNKPVMFSESGAPGLDECSNFTEWKKNAWVSPFLGVAASLNWSGFDMQQFGHLWTEYGKIKNFIGGIDFDGENWQPQENLRDDNKASLFALKKTANNNQHKAIGVIVNNTWNYWTQSIGGDCSNADDNFPGINNSIASVLYQPGANNANELHLEGMGKLKQYFIAFYHSTGTNIITKTSSAQGRLNIEYPNLWSASNEDAIIRFKVWRSNSSFYPEIITESDNIQSNDLVKDEFEDSITEIGLNEQTAEVLLYPNPATTKIFIELPPKFVKTSCILSIYNSIGELIQTFSFTQSYNEIDLANFSTGIFNFYFQNSETNISKKVVINE